MNKFKKWINENKKNSVQSKRDFVNSVWNKFKMPPIDRNKYTDLPGLEGPFILRSGKVVYYDPKEGKYYDRDTDMYMSHDDYMKHADPKNESTISQVYSGLKGDRKNLGPMAWDSLQQVYNLLKNIAQTNPERFMQIIRLINKELKNEPMADTKGLMSGARRIVNKINK